MRAGTYVAFDTPGPYMRTLRRGLLNSGIEYDLLAMRSDPLLLPALSAVLYVHLLEVERRAEIARPAAELRGSLEGRP